MVCCYECGARLRSRERDGEIQIYDFDNRIWTVKCPSCGRIGFDEEDYLDDEDYFEGMEYLEDDEKEYIF